MPYDKNDPALGAVNKRFNAGMNALDAYYDVMAPNRSKTIKKQAYNDAVIKAVNGLDGTFDRCKVQSSTAWSSFNTPKEAASTWSKSGGYDFLHIHKSKGSKYRVYIPADLRKIGEIINILWAIPSLTGFKVAGYDDANNRSDVIIGWINNIAGTNHIEAKISNSMLHGMRPPGSSIIKSGCLMGYSKEVPGSSVGTEVSRDLKNAKRA